MIVVRILGGKRVAAAESNAENHAQGTTRISSRDGGERAAPHLPFGGDDAAELAFLGRLKVACRYTTGLPWGARTIGVAPKASAPGRKVFDYGGRSS
jgi:hypothetical protein